MHREGAPPPVVWVEGNLLIRACHVQGGVDGGVGAGEVLEDHLYGVEARREVDAVGVDGPEVPNEADVGVPLGEEVFVGHASGGGGVVGGGGAGPFVLGFQLCLFGLWLEDHCQGGVEGGGGWLNEAILQHLERLGANPRAGQVTEHKLLLPYRPGLLFVGDPSGEELTAPEVMGVQLEHPGVLEEHLEASVFPGGVGGGYLRFQLDPVPLAL